MKKKHLLPIMVLLICLVLIFCKNEFTPLLLKHATCGMPALIDKHNVEHLFLGSSMFRQGLDIATLEGEANYILAYNGNQPALEYYQFLYLLENDVKIDNLYVDMYVYSAWKEPMIEDEKVFLETDLATKTTFYKLINQDNFNFSSFWRMFVTSNNEVLFFWPINNYLINRQFRNGGTLLITENANKEELDAETAYEIHGSINNTQKEYILKIVELANKEDINITFLETPKYRIISADEAYLNAMKEYAELLESNNVNYVVSSQVANYLKSDSMYLKKYDFDSSNYRYYMDKIHLSYEGRIVFTRVIKDMIESPHMVN